MKRLTLLLIVFIPLLFSCKESKKEQITRLVNEWQGKTIVFPEDIIFTQYGIDIVDYTMPETEYKIVVYVDSIGCTSCKLQLPKWKSFIQDIDSITKNAVPDLFFFHPKSAKEIHYLLKRERFDTPVCVDFDDKLNKLNQFPTDMTFQTFLLDKANKIAALGNPIHNIVVKKLYMKQITGKENTTTQLTKTTAEALQSEINLGKFGKSEKKKATVEIKNTGNAPLIIVDISTTCGCTTASYDKGTAKPGEVLQVGIEMTPNELGFFSETITVRCNTDQLIKLKIKGEIQ